jgi:DNA-binding XRE family transcriptional regulator
MKGGWMENPGSLAGLRVRQVPGTGKARAPRHPKAMPKGKSSRYPGRKLAEEIGQRIAAARVRKNMTQAELARRLGITETAGGQGLYNLERGIFAPDLVTLRLVAAILGTTIHALIPEGDDA